MKKAISIFLCIILTVCALSGCSKTEKSIDFIYPFSGNINSYDPQVSSTSDEFLVIENCFEGLVRCDDEGNILPACASSWHISDDGLTYTFYLNKGLHWYIYPSVKEKLGEDFDPEITANDFVFALQRAADGITQSPLFSTISSIVNAPEINDGRADKSTLGVRANDDYTLQITLSSPNDSFLKTMSTAVAMPCNEEFFNSTNGRYGLDLKYTMFNGQFVITNVLESSYILKNNSAYKGPSPAKAADLTLKIVSEDENLSEDILSGYYDAAYIRGYESAKIGKKSGVSLISYINTTWSLVINSTKGIFAEKDARRALALSASDLDFDKFSYLSDAYGFVPPSCKIGNTPYTEAAERITEAENRDTAVSLWKSAVKDSKIYSTDVTLLVPENMQEAAKELIQGIQAGIGAVSNVNGKSTEFTLKIEAMPESELKSRVASGDYDLALYPFTASSESPVSFLQSVANSNLSSFYKDDFNNALENALTAGESELASACTECEKALYEAYCYTPVFYESNFYAQAKGVSNVQFHPGSGRVSFVYATREG